MITINSIFKEIYKHKRILIIANIVAIISTLIILPVPLLIPILIDEIILGKSGKVTEIIDHFFTVESTEYYILIVLIVTLVAKAVSMLLNLLHIRLYTKISKEVIYTIRKKLLNHHPVLLLNIL